MAYTLAQTITWSSPYIQGIPLTAWSSAGEPALTIASMIQATINAPPFIWAFNRAVTSLSAVQGTADYSASLTDFGFIEQASVTDPTISAPNTGTWQIKDVYNTQPLSISNTQARPMAIALQSQVPGTSQVFRLSATPDKTYTIGVIYQQSPVLFTALSQQWSLPDSFIPIYNNLFLGEALADSDDVRSQQYRQRGVAGLLARASGLTDQDKATFAAQYLQQDVNTMLATLRTQQSTQARAL
jgi:hypothetical protein